MRKIYILCPAYFTTGGTELLHQLLYKLTSVFKIEAYIFYPDVVWQYEFNPTPKKFEKYVGNNVAETIEDISTNILIVPETMTHLIGNLNNVSIWLWWLSVDNFFSKLGISNHRYLDPDIKWSIRKLLNLNPYKNVNSILGKPNIVLHLYQSEYANCFLDSIGIKNKLPLSDYIDKSLINSVLPEKTQRLNQVLYNPLKGADITKKLIDSFPEIKWIPLVKMKPEEISILMTVSKVYIDFGNHPGKDRLPREAVLNGCCIIVNKEGAAKNNKDIEIPDEFKVYRPIEELNLIFALIKKIFQNYAIQYPKFENYRVGIRNEEVVFETEIEQLIKSYS